MRNYASHHAREMIQGENHLVPFLKLGLALNRMLQL